MVGVAQRMGTALNHVAHVVRGILLPSTVGVRVLAISPAGEVVLVRHRLYPGWHLPGGGIDRGETASQAAVRELFEESGVRCNIDTLKLFGVYANPKFLVSDHVILFTTTDFSVQESIRLDVEIAERRLFPLQELPLGVTSATQRRIAECHGHAQATGRW